MNLTNTEAILLSIYIILQIMAFIVIIKEGFEDYHQPTYKAILEEFFVVPYRNGIKVGNVFFALLLAPAVVVSVVLSGFFPVLFDVICFVLDVRLTKPRPRKY